MENVLLDLQRSEDGAEPQSSNWRYFELIKILFGGGKENSLVKYCDSYLNDLFKIKLQSTSATKTGGNMASGYFNEVME